jgi:hypothetical protein
MIVLITGLCKSPLFVLEIFFLFSRFNKFSQKIKDINSQIKHI